MPKSKNRAVVVVPASFRKFLIAQEKKHKELFDRKGESQKEQAAHKTYRGEMKERQCAANLPYAEVLFEWRRQFLANNTGKRAISLITTYRPDVMLAFFTWHPLMVDSTTYSLFIIPDGIRWYRWGPGSQEELCFIPEDLARAAASETPRMLADACNAIKTGEIWHWIAKDIELCINVSMHIDVSARQFG